MLNIVDILDKDKYKIFNEENTTEIYHIHNGYIEQEIFYKLIRTNSSTGLYEVSRGQHRQIGIFKDSKRAIAVLIAICHTTYKELTSNAELLDELHKANEDNSQFYWDLFKKECDSRFYSLTKVDKNVICLIKEDNLYSIYYKDRAIVRSVKLNRALTVTINYVTILKQYDDLYNNKISKLDLQVNYEELIEYYLFG